ncbi:hypothetical protein PV10_01199 [Exophiala mesophila]|uniref:PRKR-interacting protein 1 n=1 Tax=Exophiala mesophila TaxID=212818 RepID=A0A0D1ZSD5_EXOME|nr:uncharacterized protein PV10_01199 [Exophiala mesophila]KIV97447.1 hypothetical protein PV10_01199 [Exophiala mesophila]
MSEPIPESIPTSADRRSHRPIKRARGANTALVNQANEIETLFLDPSKPVSLPSASSANGNARTLAAPPEIVANVQGSSAGAGSGEFHVYKASRRREYERLRLMEEEAKKEEDDEKWEREERERKERDEERTRKNREKRMKKKGKGKGNAKDSASGPGVSVGAGDATENNGAVDGNRKKGGLQIPKRADGDDDQTSDFGVAEIAKETGITIHDDD